ncbi:L-serine ammonia-lyase, iron-sulfur-dependent, subunit alpha [Clostridium sp. MSJ-8]|uniref:L-serine ammonia-lyase, iron-sulfur-dependent, subunit alpha n=1 Tax=Clostridium sp. MSJ-8 TaxID=2841510 RepID=UPI001C0ED792|nr:L-serine ammonia-lyase, iron-sulfur-dependent, subunit alpha [Clostridium sp. MSJ-8]MBU5488306.1 L-serine ammonia-lyase, iron-sulfur-dependent, subunit alpha [Clostridium sp. MSJ-8]
MAFRSMKEIMDRAEKLNGDIVSAIVESECKDYGMDKEDVYLRMEEMWSSMYQAGIEYDETLHSKSGLVGTDGQKMINYIQKEESYSGDFMGNVIAEAIKMGESNACMKRIVAAPTAGSCGVLPAVLITSFKKFSLSTQEILDSLFVAAGIGQVISERASLAGATGGCQAEIGSAAAMAAGALVHLKGGSLSQISNAVAIALKNMLGLVCDPVAGLVEVPCVKRNVAGAVNAIAAADMALAGISSNIPADEVIDAMREIGDDMPTKYKETACGGCAVTETGKRIAKKMKDMQKSMI